MRRRLLSTCLTLAIAAGCGSGDVDRLVPGGVGEDPGSASPEGPTTEPEPTTGGGAIAEPSTPPAAPPEAPPEPDAAKLVESPAGYNPDMGNASECIPLARTPAAALVFDGSDTGFRYDDIKWGDGTCPNGSVRVQQYPPLKMAGKRTYFSRGGIGSTSTDTVIRHNHIWVADLVRSPSQVTLPTAAGKACQNLIGQTFYANPEGTSGLGTIPSDMHYKPTAGGAKWHNYGDTVYAKGTFKNNQHHAYLLWNWKWNDGSGGGQVEATVKKGHPIEVCGVKGITSPSYDKDGVKNGEVRGLYGKITNSDGTAVYGWFSHAWRRTNAQGQPTSAWSYLVTAKPI